MEKLCNKEKLFSVCAIIICALFFYGCIFDIGIHSVDDWDGVNANTYGWEVALRGIIDSVIKPQRHLFADTITRFLNYCQMGLCNMIVFRLFTFLGIGVSVYSLYVLLMKVVNERFAIGTVLIFLFGAQIFDLNYNGFISFSWVYQIQISLAFLCLILRADYYETQKRRFLVEESILYFAACCFYESFIFICLPMLAITLKARAAKGKIGLKDIISDLWMPAASALLFLVTYLYFYLHESSFSYAGTQVGSSIRIPEMLRTLAVLSFSNVPGYLTLIDKARALKYVVSHLTTYPLLYLIILLIAILGSFSYINVCNKQEKNHKRDMFILLAVSIVTALLIALPLAITPHYIGGVISGMLVNYGVAYYCWFFIAVGLNALIQLINQNLGGSKALRWSIATIFIVVSFFSMASNDYYHKARNEEFYSAETVAQSELFLSDENATDLFLLGFDPVFGDRQTIISSINKASGMNFSAKEATGPYYYECTPGSAFIRRFPGTSHGEIVTANLDEDFCSDTVTVFIPHYDGTQHLKIEYGPDFSMEAIFPLDGSAAPDVIRSELVDTDFGGRIVRLTLNTKYDFRYALTFLTILR